MSELGYEGKDLYLHMDLSPSPQEFHQLLREEEVLFLIGGWLNLDMKAEICIYTWTLTQGLEIFIDFSEMRRFRFRLEDG